MKFLNINATISVKPQFSGEVLKAGTPLDISGSEANSDAAVGIVASDTAVGAESIAIVTEGTIDLTELTASYGSALTDECIAALKGITFLYGGKAVVPAGGGLPSVSSTDNGKVLTVANGAWSAQTPSGGGGQFIITVTPNEEETELSVDKTYQEIASAFAEGKTFYILYSFYSTPFAAVCVREDDDTYSIEGGYTSLEAVSEDTAEIGVFKIEVTADAESGIVAFSEHSFVSGTYSSIPPLG